MQPTVFVIDDNQTVREFLETLFKSIELNVISFANAAEFLQYLAQPAPAIRSGCILLDVRMPQMSGIELQAHLVQRNSVGLPVIFLTGHADVPMAVNALKSGAFDFIQKPFNNQQLVDRVQKAIRFSEEKIRHQSKSSQKANLLAQLTAREQQVFSLLVKGHTNIGVAKILSVGTKTVETHRVNILKKLNVKNLADLIEIDQLDRETTPS